MGRRGNAEMTYRLEPGLCRITSPVLLIFPDGTEKRYENGREVTEAVFGRRWRVADIRAVDNTVEIRVEESLAPEINAVGEETFF